MKTNTYYAVNWTDGVKLTKNHFVESYFNGIDTLRDRVQTRIHTYDYGLLQTGEGMSSALEIETQTHTEERLVLVLHSCNALTEGGCKIEFSLDKYGGNAPVAKLESKNINTNSTLEFYVMVTVNPFELVPAGEPDPEVIPLHHPYVLPKVSLKIIPKDRFNGSFLDTYFLLAGKVYWRNGGFVIDKEYIPPVSRIMYHKPLHDFYKKITQVVLRLRNYAVIINKKNRHKLQHNKLVRNTFMLSTKVMDFVSQHIFELKQTGEEQPPVYIAQKVAVLANYLSDTLSIMEESEREKLLQYYYEWIDIKPSAFETALGDVIDMDYDHQDINSSLNKVDYFMAVMDKLWKRLSDLEYIGQRKDNIVISEERMSIRSTSKSKSWSIID